MFSGSERVIKGPTQQLFTVLSARSGGLQTDHAAQ